MTAVHITLTIILTALISGCLGQVEAPSHTKDAPSHECEGECCELPEGDPCLVKDFDSYCVSPKVLNSVTYEGTCQAGSCEDLTPKYSQQRECALGCSTNDDGAFCTVAAD